MVMKYEISFYCPGCRKQSTGRLDVIAFHFSKKCMVGTYRCTGKHCDKYIEVKYPTNKTPPKS